MSSDFLGQRYPAPTWWEVAPLEDVAVILDSYREPINNKERQNRIDGKKVSELFPYFGATGQVGYIDDYKLNGKYVLLGEDGAPFLEGNKAKAYIAKGRIWVNNHAHILAPKIDTDFFCYYLNSVDYASVVTGTTRLKLNQRAMRKIAIAIPPLPEQRRIVAKIEELFSELDNGVESLKAARGQLKTYRQSLLKAAFEGRLTEQWRCDNAEKLESADEILERIREAHSKQDINGRATVGAELNKEKAVETRPRAISITEHDRVAMPTGWIKLDLGSFVRSIDAGKSYKCEERPPEEGEYGLAKISAVTWGKYDERESKTCTRTDLVNDRYLIRDGDFLISRANTIELVGACVIAEGTSRNIMLSDKILRLNFLGVNERYVMFYLWSEMGRAEIERRASGNQMSMRNIGQERIRAIPIPIPSVAEQNAIVEKVESGLSKAEAILAEIDAALDRVDALRRSILKRAFEGKLVPQDPDDEPASVLLERIRAEQEKEPKSAKGRRKTNA